MIPAGVWWTSAGFVGGAIAGSFLATIVVRWPRGERVASGRSHCDGCGRALSAAELVPLASALVQRGRCRTCGAPIAAEHVVLEWGCAAIGAGAFGAAPGLAGGGWALFGWLLLALAMLDWRYLWLPDRLTAPLWLGGLLVGGLTTGVGLLDRVVGGVAGWATLALITVAYRRVRGRDGLGAGDAKLLGAIGAWLGWTALPLVLVAASVVGLVAVGLAALGGYAVRRDTALPFGAALAVGALPGWLASGALGLIGLGG